MSLVLGFWPATENHDISELCGIMYEAIKGFPHSKHHFEIRPDAGFGHLLTINTPQAPYEILPTYLTESQILFTAQGRIDNRVQLARKLEQKINDQYADGKLILQSYLKWGKNCVDHLKGDWSFAVLDCKNHELFIARDPMGYTSLYYYQDETGFYFSSSIKSLLALPSYQKKINELHFIRQLTLWDDSVAQQDTYFKGIFSLPIAHMLTVKDKRITVQRYWYPQNIPLQYRKNRQDYADEMFYIFQSAVEARLSSHKPVASMLSGGLDSSAVSYVAADLLKSQQTTLVTYSHVPLFAEEMKYDREHHRRVLNETPLIMDVVHASKNIDPRLLTSENQSIINGMMNSMEVCNAPSHGAANLYWLYDIYKTTSQDGFGTLLSGEGGNGSISFAGIDYLLPFNLTSLTVHPYQFFKRQIVKRIGKVYFNKYLNKRRDIVNNLEKYVSNIFLNQSFLDTYQITKDISEKNKELYPYVSDIQNVKELFIDFYYLRSLRGGTCGHYYGFDLRDPCTDLDVMEYLFSIPNEAFFDNHYNNRMLVKRMMKGKIPDSVLFERRKGLQSADIAFRVKAQANEISAAIQSVNRSAAANHYIDVRKLVTTWQSYSSRPYLQPYQIQRLLKALQFALFLQINFD